MTFELRTGVEPSSLVPEIRRAVQRVDPDLASSRVKSQRQQIAEAIALPRTLATVTTACGAVGLLLACLGLYGLVSFDVAQRTGEIGIRMALGARHADVIQLVLRELLGVVGLGVAARLGLAVVVATATLAGYLPARRACRVDPGRALRSE
jgi:ABC-type antimicrobial peptide transport system permease subunit